MARWTEPAKLPSVIPALTTVLRLGAGRSRNRMSARERIFRIGYYSRQDGLETLWLVDAYGRYAATTTRAELLKRFVILRLGRATDPYGIQARPLPSIESQRLPRGMLLSRMNLNPLTAKAPPIPDLLPPRTTIRILEREGMPRPLRRRIGQRYVVDYYERGQPMDRICLVNGAGAKAGTMSWDDMARYGRIIKLGRHGDLYGADLAPMKHRLKRR